MRAHGPYKHGRRFRVVTVAANGDRRRRTFATERDALDYLATFTREAHGVTLASAVDDYLKYAAEQGRKPTTLTTLGHRLRALLRTKERERPIAALTPSAAARLIERRRAEVAIDTQVGELVAAQGFTAWCTERGWLRVDPLKGLKVAGARARGKPQLRIDEARRYVAHALDEGSTAGLAAAIALLMGLRASEITGRAVRDVDDGARVLWIERAKTRKGDRHLEVPAVLRPRLAELIRGRDGGEQLFGDVDRHWLGRHVRRLCKAAGVPPVTPHGLRGTQASISVLAVPAEHVAAALGQTGPAVTRRHYLAGGAEERGRGRAVMTVIEGGKKP